MKIQRINGVDIREVNINSLRSFFGLVSQESVVFDMTIAENIAYAKENVPMESVIEVATKTNIHQFIQQLPQVSIRLMLNIGDCLWY